MFASLVVYAGLATATLGLAAAIRPISRLGIPTRARGATLVVAGIVISIIGLVLPVSDHRVARVESRLDEFMPAWQFNERHSIEIGVPPERAFDAMKAVTADEIFLFRALTWIRRGGRPLPESILNAGKGVPLIDVATRSGFVTLADDPPRELVIGTIVKRPAGPRVVLGKDVFRNPLPPGFAIAAMNFLVGASSTGGSTVITETRVFASSPDARRAFGRYWRVIYPGSALIRVMWLRAIKRRAERGRAVGTPH